LHRYPENNLFTLRRLIPIEDLAIAREGHRFFFLPHAFPPSLRKVNKNWYCQTSSTRNNYSNCSFVKYTMFDVLIECIIPAKHNFLKKNNIAKQKE